MRFDEARASSKHWNDADRIRTAIDRRDVGVSDLLRPSPRSECILIQAPARYEHGSRKDDHRAPSNYRFTMGGCGKNVGVGTDGMPGIPFWNGGNGSGGAG